MYSVTENQAIHRNVWATMINSEIWQDIDENLHVYKYEAAVMFQLCLAIDTLYSWYTYPW